MIVLIAILFYIIIVDIIKKKNESFIEVFKKK